MRTLALLLFLAPLAALAQRAQQADTQAGSQTEHPAERHFNFVAPSAAGRVVLPPAGEGWQANQAFLYDDGTRPLVSFENSSTHVILSVLLFPNQTGAPTAESCRDAVLSPILASMREHSTLEDQRRESSTADGIPFATARYLIARAGDIPIRDENVFGFFGNASTCAEIHLSKVRYTPKDAAGLDAALAQFRFDASYQPVSQDYATMGSLLAAASHDHAQAAIYYRRALDTLPSPPDRDYRRFVTDQLGMSLGQGGQLDEARSVFETGAAADPGYPMYPYNLACADAEQGNAAAARVHLQQAFDRRGNILAGEAFPDPAQDSSLQKLEANTDFWSFVLSLSRQLSR